MITKYKKHHRIIATVFLLIFFPTLVPSNLFASNNGPVAPEANSFEPVDAADMVNLATGDMSYVLPLLNVPSPEGGYPLALSNHAGIAIDQEASWVGLGWSLNPGAINRSVTGVPDDWKNTNTNQIIYDAGGESTTYSAGVSIGWSHGTYSLGLFGSYSENKTFGGTTTHSINGGVEGSVGLLSASLGTQGASIGISKGGKNGNMGFGGSLSVNQSFKNGSTGVSVGAGISEYDKSGDQITGGSIGISFNSSGSLSASTSIGNFSLPGNGYSPGALNVSSLSVNLVIPIYCVNVSLGYSKAKYWTYENNFTKNNGSLYAGDMVKSYNDDDFPTTLAFDSYNSIYKLKSDEQLDGDNLSNIAYDNYSASGQGISGSFKAAIFEQGTLLNNFKDKSTNNSTVSYSNGVNDSFTKTVSNNLNDIHFYFENELSSFLKVSSGNWDTSSNSNTPEQISPVRVSLKQNGLTTIDGVQYNGYDSATKRKRTGSYIETFTNKEIKDSNGSIIINPENYDRTSAPEDGIGAFKITSVDGKVYHYSIPVYQKEMFSKSTDLTSDFNNRYYEKQQLIPYATHWLLTAITGPDYVDVNLNNKVDEGDYGYWTTFDYGKWSDGFVWGTPTKSNDKTKSYEWGVKEVYYLDKIKTRTHTAIFVKEERQDDLSYNLTGNNQVGNNENDLAWINKVSRSFIKSKDGIWYFRGIYNNKFPVSSASPAYSILEGNYGQFIKCNTHKSLKLSKILLLKNDDAIVSKTLGQSSSSFKGQIKFAQHFVEYNINGQTLQTVDDSTHNESWDGEFYNNVYDTKDVTSNLEQKAIKTIQFNYNSTNPLAKGCPNSNTPSTGRLTLESVEFQGKNKAKVIPPYRFEYINGDYNATMEDNWGYYKNMPDVWSLNKVVTPTGAEINIQYESDDIDKEAVRGIRGFDGGLQFSFSNYNGKLRIKVENETGNNSIVNFQDFFQIGTVALDLWASFKHDYNDYGCEARKGAVDINTNVQVVSVSSSNIVLETDLSSCYNDNGGLDWLFARIVGLKYHPDMIIENYGRGEWGEPPGCINVTDRLVLVYALKGNIMNLALNQKNGGGIRVKEINIKEDNVIKNSTKYFYNVPGFAENKTDVNYKSSGITSFVPQKYFKEIKYITDLPSPGVMYEYVTVKNYSENNILGVTEQYNFNVLKQDISTNEDEMILPGILEITKVQSAEVAGTNKINYSHYNIKDETAALGRLNEKKIFNSSLQLISDEKYNFRKSNNIYQGISEESFNTYKKVSNNGNVNYRLAITSKMKYPSMLESIVTTQAGYSNTNYIDKYDFLTGQVIETYSLSSDGQSFKTKTVPAYSKNDYREMGSKVDNINNKNMLSQTAANYSYILDKASNDWKITGVGITTWSNIWSYKDIAGTTVSVPATSPAKEKIWRKHKTYVWNGVKDTNGIFTNYDTTIGSKDDKFVWTVGVGSQLSQWKQTSEVTLYDHFSAPLEMKDINGNYASTKMGDSDTKIMATGNAGYGEMFFAGAENLKPTTVWLEPEVQMTNALRNSTYFHTGKQSIAATAGSQFGVSMKNLEHRAGKYKVSVWVEKTNAAKARLKVNGTIVNFQSDTILAGNWQLKTAYITVPAGACTVYLSSADTSTVYFDDLMIRPVASSITGYVYNEWDELTHIIGNNGLATRFEYDAAGRLVKTYSEIVDYTENGVAVTGGFKLASENGYNYKKPL